MSIHRKLMTSCSVAVLAFGLAACGSDGDDGKLNTANEERDAALAAQATAEAAAAAAAMAQATAEADAAAAAMAQATAEADAAAAAMAQATAEADQATAEADAAAAAMAQATAEADAAAAATAQATAEADAAAARTAQATAEADAAAAATAQATAEADAAAAATAQATAEADAAAAATAQATAEADAAAAATAQATAEADAAAAATAQATAEADAAAAATAQATAEADAAAAATAQATAEADAAAAATAQATAEADAAAAATAQATAEGERDDAMTAQMTAEGERDDAMTAQMTAEGERDDAMTAQMTAEGERDDAVTAQMTAEGERDDAVTAQMTAEGERDDAVTAQMTAEGERDDAVTAQMTAEGERDDAVTAQMTAEGERDDAVTAQMTAEGERDDAVTAQMTAEGERDDAVTAQMTAEGERDDAVTAQMTAEGERDAAIERAETAEAELQKLEDEQADAMAMAQITERIAREAAVRTAIEGNRVGTSATAFPTGVTAQAVTRNAARMMTVDVGDEDYAGRETNAGSGDWNDFTLTKTNTDESEDTLVIYTDIEAPSDKLLTAQYTQTQLDDALDEMTVGKAQSSGFPSSPGTSWDYTGEADERAKTVTGTFDGVPGQFTCTATADCTVMTDSEGEVEPSENWRFTPASPLTAMVKDPDAAYAYFGWWLNKPKDNTAVHDVEVFAGGTTGHEANVTNDIEGNATYTGAAAGKYVTKSFSAGVQNDAGVGHFTATANLTAKFGTDAAAGTIGGAVTSFVLEDGSSRPWKVTLDDADLNNGDAIFNGVTTVNFGGADVDPAGTWQGSFYADADATDDTNAPDTVAGTFDADTTNASVIGGFGATKQ